jgi:hypothetical protein
MQTSRPRQTTALNAKLDRRLFAYAAAASAAGVSALALAQPAEAKVVYTKTHVVLTASPKTIYPLDLNRDGINDFSLLDTNTSLQNGVVMVIRCLPVRADRALGKDYQSALRQGVKVGHGDTFSSGYERMGLFGYTTTHGYVYAGPWVNNGKGVKNRYLGLKFTIKNKTHYGWARLSVAIDHSPLLNITETLTGYAYETVPNKPIVTGRTNGADVVRDKANDNTLGHLALGAASPPGPAR